MHPDPPTPQNPPPRPSRLSTILCSFLAVVIVFVFVGLSSPLVLKSKKKSDLTEALSNARQVGLALIAFEVEYGRFPDAETAADVTERTGRTIAPPSDTANAYFRQLLAAGIANSEQIFYAKTAFTQRPDDMFDTPSSALAPGEVGFGYVLNVETGLSTAAPPSAIILCYPLAYDGRKISSSRFDPKPHNGRMVVLRMDNTATALHIDRTTGDFLIDGKNWLTPGEGTIWGTDVIPRVAVPEPR